MWGVLLALLVFISVFPAAAQVYGPIIEPPKPMAAIEFIEEAGVERWRVKLSGEKLSSDSAYMRISGSSCTQMGEIYKGLVTPLYENMTFKTASGRECRVLAIER